MLLDYTFLKIIWWVLIIVLFIAFAVTDGFDMGSAALLPIFKKEDERRVILNSVGRFWDGNQVWLVTAGGAVFAAWPLVYSSIFAALYLPMFVIVVCLMIRAAGFEFRSKMETEKARRAWDLLLAASGFVVPLILGVAAGNALLGLPFEYDEFSRPHYSGGFFNLLSPFALLTGVIGSLMFLMHGAAWLRLTTDESMQSKLKKALLIIASTLLLLFLIAGAWSYTLHGFKITTIGDIGSSLSIMEKTVVQTKMGGLFNNYLMYPWMIVAPVLAIVSILLTLYLNAKDKFVVTLITSALAQAGIILTLFFSLFPFVVPSLTQPEVSLTIWDAVSSQLTLTITFGVAIVMVPIIILYTAYVYSKLWGRIKMHSISKKESHIIY